MRGGVANHVEAVGILVGDDGQRGIGIDHMAGIDQLAIDPPGERRLGQTRADAGCNLRDRDRRIKLPNRTIGKRDVDHDSNSRMKKSADRPRF